MHLGAILVTGNRTSSTAVPVGGGKRLRREGETVSLACVDVLGQSILERTVARLQRTNVPNIFIVASSACTSLAQSRGARVTFAKHLAERWSVAQRILAKQSRRGIDTVFIGHIGAYAEFDFDDALKFHRAQGQHLTSFCDSQGELGYWFVEAEWLLSARNLQLPFAHHDVTRGSVPYRVTGYVNRLADAFDFRRLVIDAFLGRCCVAPRGREVKPGIWIDDDVQLHETARIVAPAYLGRNTAVHSAAVITRFSNLERRCQVGEGSVVAHASVLPHTAIGRGLDISSAIVDGSEWVDLRRNIALQIADPNLIANTAAAQPSLPFLRDEHDDTVRDVRQPEPAFEPELRYPGYLSRAAGRVLEVFKDEV